MFKREEEDFTRTAGGNLKKNKMCAKCKGASTVSVRQTSGFLNSHASIILNLLLQFTNKDISSLDKEVAEW